MVGFVAAFITGSHLHITFFQCHGLHVETFWHLLVLMELFAYGIIEREVSHVTMSNFITIKIMLF